MTKRSLPQPEVPGWDWDENDYSWLSSASGISKDGVSIFFIHGGRVRHQAHIGHGSYPLEDFIARLRELSEGLDHPTVCWTDGSGEGDYSLWVEGTRLPAEEDVARLQAARDREERTAAQDLRWIKQRFPHWFGSDERVGKADTP